MLTYASPLVLLRRQVNSPSSSLVEMIAGISVDVIGFLGTAVGDTHLLAANARRPLDHRAGGGTIHLFGGGRM